MLHAYILSGPGEATSARAREMAAAALCEGSGPKPCRACRHCRKVFQGPFPGIHPDVTVVERELNASGDPKQEIMVDQIRTLVRESQILPNEADARVYILPEADRMNLQAQNAFLKLLEEPPAFDRFLLCAENPERLLETVRSRCGEIRLGGAAPGPDRQTALRAEGYLDALKDPVELLRCTLAMEKLEGPQLLEIVRTIMEQAPRRGLPVRQLVELEDFLRRAEAYLSANVGPKLVAGYLSTFTFAPEEK